MDLRSEPLYILVDQIFWQKVLLGHDGVSVS